LACSLVRAKNSAAVPVSRITLLLIFQPLKHTADGISSVTTAIPQTWLGHSLTGSRYLRSPPLFARRWFQSCFLFSGREVSCPVSYYALKRSKRECKL
jgi:hypothetical protein